MTTINKNSKISEYELQCVTTGVNVKAVREVGGVAGHP